MIFLLIFQMKAPFDPNKLYVSEILSILVQDCTENRLLLGDLDGIDVLLQQLAVCIFVCKIPLGERLRLSLLLC